MDSYFEDFQPKDHIIKGCRAILSLSGNVWNLGFRVMIWALLKVQGLPRQTFYLEQMDRNILGTQGFVSGTSVAPARAQKVQSLKP